jgi:methyl-accepting chemotaxis protein
VEGSAHGLASVSKDVRAVTTSAEQSLAIAKEIRADSSQLASMSDDLRAVVNQFRV